MKGKTQTSETFWAQVKIGKPNECWPWQGVIDVNGYGKVSWGAEQVGVHRVVAWLGGMVKSLSAPRNRRGTGFVLHTCDVRHCCNPQHIYVGAIKYKSKQTPESFWAKVKIGEPNECWPWLGYVNPQGYGMLSWNNRQVLAPRVAAWLSGMVKVLSAPRDRKYGRTFILHTCDNPRCCNPHHLRRGTLRQNTHDSIQKGRRRYMRGEEHGMSKLTAVQVRAIRKRYATGTISQTRLGAVYGIDPSMVGLIVRNKNWRHI